MRGDQGSLRVLWSAPNRHGGASYGRRGLDHHAVPRPAPTSTHCTANPNTQSCRNPYMLKLPYAVPPRVPLLDTTILLTSTDTLDAGGRIPVGDSASG